MKRNDMHIKHIPNILAAACILHNICEKYGEHFNKSRLQSIDALILYLNQILRH